MTDELHQTRKARREINQKLQKPPAPKKECFNFGTILAKGVHLEIQKINGDTWFKQELESEMPACDAVTLFYNMKSEVHNIHQNKADRHFEFISFDNNTIIFRKKLIK